MRRAATLWITTGIALVALSCDVSKPLAPDQTRLATPTLSASATSTWTRGSIFVDATGFAECLGEDIHFLGENRFIFHQVTSAGGVTQNFFQFTPIVPNGPPFGFTGVTTGRFYPLQNGQPINQVTTSGPAGTFSYEERDVYYNAANVPSEVFATHKIHVTVNANGTVTVNRDEFSGIVCIDR